MASTIPPGTRSPDPQLLAVARGDEPADLVLRNGWVVNVFTGEVEKLDVAVARGRVAGMGPDYEAHAQVDLEGRYLLPGFLDAHVHIESSMVAPPEFARAVVPRGTTTAITDPHEIANVHGLEGIDYMLAASEGLPMDVFVMASSCVPATPMGTSGAELTASDLARYRDHPRVLGLAELMNFPGAIGGDPGVLEKVAMYAHRVVDGHCPGISGQDLSAYVAAGPSSDHEATTAEEALEKLRRGLWVFFRQATNARNLDALLPALTPENAGRVALCTDDRQPPDLLDEGGIDFMVRRVVAHGVDPIQAIRLATLNPANYFGLWDRGAVAPGRRADLVVTSSLEELPVEAVYHAGQPVAEDGALVPGLLPDSVAPPQPSMHVDADALDFRIPAREGKARAIGVVPDQLVTRHESVEPRVVGDEVVADPEADLLKIAVVERHGRGGGRAVGLVRGLGFKEGGLAGTVAHDHHNLIVAGADDPSMEVAARRVAELQGGLAVARDGAVVAELSLPVGGLMSDRDIHQTREAFEKVVAAARGLGSHLWDPFMALSFLGLEVIPDLKITDQGLVDVRTFQPVGLWE